MSDKTVPKVSLVPHPKKVVVLTNKETGEVFELAVDPESKAKYRFKKALKALTRYQLKHGLKDYFLTVTFNTKRRTDEEVDKILEKLANYLNRRFARRGERMKYLWVRSMQVGRLAEHKDKVNARNYHFIIVCYDGSLPNQVETVKSDGSQGWKTVQNGFVLKMRDLRRYWKPHGIIHCGLVRDERKTRNYMWKNFDEAADHRISLAKRFSSSQLGYYAYPQWAFEAIEKAYKERPELADCKVIRRGSEVVFFREEGDRLTEVHSIASPLVFEGVVVKNAADQPANNEPPADAPVAEERPASSAKDNRKAVFAPVSRQDKGAEFSRELPMAERCRKVAAANTPAGATIEYRKSLTGRASAKRNWMSVPKPVTRKSLYIYLHECAHIHLKHGPNKPRHVKEMEAEKWAHKRMREAGMVVPRSMTRRAKQYVARKIEQARRRGAKKIDPQALAYARARSRWWY